MPVAALPARGQSLGSGGFGHVYVDPTDPALCIKVFSTPLKGPQYTRLMDAVALTTGLRPSERHWLTTRFAWPLEAFGTARKLVGYRMPRAPEDAMFDLVIGANSSRMVLQAKYLMDASYWRGNAVQSENPELVPDGRLLVIADLLRSIELLHAHGYAYNDLSANNLCVVNADLPRVFLLDADSIAPIDAVGEPVVRTIGWEVDDRFDIAQRDWAKVAMFAWRLLLEEPNRRPSSGAVDDFDIRTGTGLGRVITELHDQPDPATAKQFHAAVIARLTAASGDRLLQEAAGLGFAREVLRLRDLAGGDARLVAEAKEHMLLEERVEASQGLQRRLLLRGLRRQGRRPFMLDVGGVALDDVPPSSIDQFEQLVLNARFEEILGHFVDGHLGGFASHPWLPRAVQHALTMEPAASIDVSERAGVVCARFEWPRGGLIDAALLRIWEDRRLADTRVIERQAGHDAVRIEGLGSGLPPGTPVQVQVVFGVSGGAGSIVYCPESATVAAAAPQPDRRLAPRIPTPIRGSARRIARSSEALVDVARPDPQAPARRRRRARRRAGVLVAAAAAVGVIIFLGGQGDESFEATARTHLEGTQIIWAVRSPDETAVGVRSAVIQRQLIGPVYRRGVLAETGIVEAGETVRTVVGAEGTFRVRARLADGRSIRSGPLTAIDIEGSARGGPPPAEAVTATADEQGRIVIRWEPIEAGAGRIVDHHQVIVSGFDGSTLLRMRTGRRSVELEPLEGVTAPLELSVRVRVITSDGARSTWAEATVLPLVADVDAGLVVTDLRREGRSSQTSSLRWTGTGTDAYEVLLVDAVTRERRVVATEAPELRLDEIFAPFGSDVLEVQVRIVRQDGTGGSWSPALNVTRPKQ